MKGRSSMRMRPQVFPAVWSVGLALLGMGCPTTYVTLGEEDAGSSVGAAGAAGNPYQGAGAGGMYVDCNLPYDPASAYYQHCWGSGSGGRYVAGAGGEYAGGAGGYVGGAGGEYAGGGG